MARKKQALRQDELVRVFATRLRKWRKKRGLSQQELARRAGIALSYTARLETGTIAPGLDMIAKVARALAVNPEKLIAAEVGREDELNLAFEMLEARLKSLRRRQDAGGLMALAVVAGLVDLALARQRR